MKLIPVSLVVLISTLTSLAWGIQPPVASDASGPTSCTSQTGNWCFSATVSNSHTGTGSGRACFPTSGACNNCRNELYSRAAQNSTAVSATACGTPSGTSADGGAQTQTLGLQDFVKLIPVQKADPEKAKAAANEASKNVLIIIQNRGVENHADDEIQKDADDDFQYGVTRKKSKERVCVISDLTGEVMLRGLPARIGDVVHEGDRIETGPKGRVEITLETASNATEKIQIDVNNKINFKSNGKPENWYDYKDAAERKAKKLLDRLKGKEKREMKPGGGLQG